MKKMSIRNMRVRSKLLFFSAVALVMLLVVAMLSIWVLTVTNKTRAKTYSLYGDSELALSEGYTAYNKLRTDVRDITFLYAEDAQKRKEKENDIAEQVEIITTEFAYIEQHLNEYEDKIHENYQKLQSYMQEYYASIETIVTYVEQGDMENAIDELETTGVKSATQVEEVFVPLLDDLIAEAKEDTDAIDLQVQVLTIVLVAICALAFVIVLGFCFSIVKQIAAPIAKMKEASRKMALGDIDVDCEKINNDDLGELLDEFAAMRDAIKSQVFLAEEISKGDLTVHAEVRSEQDVLGKAFQRLLADNNRNLGNIKESSTQVTIGAEQVASASQSLAQGSTQQASALEEVTASVAEIAERTKENAAQASEADSLVQNVKSSATNGNGQMKSMIGAMNDINESSETISKIIKTIDDIAFQTNILALNAAVEAARAGVHGKGFAVVAEEVRNLAAKSASAASETAEMIEDSIRKVSNGTKLAEETERSLDEIVSAIERVVGLISEIAAAANDQATAVSQIDQAIEQVSTVVQTNSATSQQCAAASEELSNQAANLRELLSNYKLTTGLHSSNFDSDSSSSLSSYDTDNYNEQIISLDGEFGKY